MLRPAIPAAKQERLLRKSHERCHKERVDGVMSGKCVCGKPKMPGDTFCKRCFRLLPSYVAERLAGTKMDDGFVEAHGMALERLRKVGIVK